MSKIFEHLIHQQLAVHLEKILHDSMFGFRKYYGCPTALLALTTQWKDDLDNHNKIGTVAIDLSKACDCLSQERKFYSLGDHALSLMRSYLSSRHERVKLGTTFSTWEGVLRGFHPGSVLGPTLFDIFVYDLAYAITQYKIINYVDDTNIHCSDKNVRAVEDNLNSDLKNATRRFNTKSGKVPGYRPWQSRRSAIP